MSPGNTPTAAPESRIEFLVFQIVLPGSNPVPSVCSSFSVFFSHSIPPSEPPRFSFYTTFGTGMGLRGRQVLINHSLNVTHIPGKAALPSVSDMAHCDICTGLFCDSHLGMTSSFPNRCKKRSVRKSTEPREKMFLFLLRLFLKS